VATRSLHDASTVGYVLAEPSPATATPTVPGYDVLEPLGEGGMGAVWKARQTNLNRLVALKMVLGDQRAGSKELIRFLAEAEAVAAVRHPHVVQVYEYGEAGGRPFLALEYLPGGSLADRLKQDGRLDPKAAAELVGTLAAALQAAHDLGIVHRDLKPGNVLFDDRGTPKVTDFGLAKRAGGGDLTSTRAVLGTPAYMAPEQARGDTKFVGPQADVYSLGVILYECLTGTKPFQAPDQLALLRRVLEEEPERPGRRAPRVPRDVELICLKCLAKDPAERYQSAGALAADLRRFAAGELVSVRAAGLVERVARWARRKPTLAAAYTLGLLAVLLGGLGGRAVWQWRAAERARDRADAARGESERARGREAEARGEAERQREKFERFDYGRAIQLAYQDRQVGSGAKANELLRSARRDLRGWEWHYVWNFHTPPQHLRIDDRTARIWDDNNSVLILALKGHTAPIRTATFSPDGSRVLTGSDDGTARIWSYYDVGPVAKVLELNGHTAAVRTATFSPDGSRVITGSDDGTARVWHARSGALILTRRGHASAVTLARFIRDGTQVITGDAPGDLEAWDPRTGHNLEGVILNEHFPEWSSAMFIRSGNGSQVVIRGPSGPVNLWNAVGRQFFVPLEELSPWEPATFSPGGSRLVAGDDRGTVRIWDAQSGALLLALKGHTGSVHSATFSPDGERLLTSGADGTARVWFALSFKEWTASELRLISWGDGSGVPTSGKDLVIVGTDSDDLLHIRAFGGLDESDIDALETRDSSGALHLKRFGFVRNTSYAPRLNKKSVPADFGDPSDQSDALESSLLAAQSGAITALKQRLPGLLPPHVLSGAERDQVLSAVTLIIGARQIRWR
jgi:tRNA A-37 threonylcarbamoyl transferase component Bud32